ncbi:MAG: hypothetical protein EPN60_10590, partial [Nevskiaceae bacterium]
MGLGHGSAIIGVGRGDARPRIAGKKKPRIQPPPLQRLTDGIARLGLSLPPDAPVRLLAYQAEL